MRPEHPKYSFSDCCFRVIRSCIRLCYPKMHLIGERQPEETPTVIIANHAQIHGPICAELYTPKNTRIWCTWQMMHLKEVPAYAYQDFWGSKPRYTKWFYKLLSYIIAPLSVCVFRHAKTIPVYRDTRLVTTFKESVRALQDGSHLLIFPESAEPYNEIVNDFQDRWVDIARLYYKHSGKRLTFTPLYISPELKCMVYGEPIIFDPEAPSEIERKRICHSLADAITALAIELPPHKVVPYANIPRKKYPMNRKK